MKIFNSMIPNNTSCIRDGELNRETPVSVIVKGDVVQVKAGDLVPADIRIIDSKGFKVPKHFYIYLTIYCHSLEYQLILFIYRSITLH